MKHIFTPILLLCCLTAIAQTPASTRHDYAYFFAVTDFEPGWAPLPETIEEVREIAGELATRYGFDTTVMHNANGTKMIAQLEALTRKKFGTNDQVLIFFSMHGYLDEKAKKGYLIPADGPGVDKTNATASWLEHSKLRELIGRIPNAHILTALDACFSGAFSGMKSRPTDSDPCGDFCHCRIQQALSSDTRYYLTAGAAEVVPADSKFADRWLEALRSNGGEDGLLTFAELYTYLETVSPMPRWGTMEGHAQGNFLFVSKNACNGAAPPPPGDPANFAMIQVDGGTFEMGDLFNEGESDEFPVHTVELRTFWMDPAEVTFETFDLFCKETNRTRPSDSGQGRGKKPVINVSWYDAVEFCNWRSQKMGLDPCYTINKRLPPDPNNENYDDLKRWTVTWVRSANGFRLPTEAEWEYAAREKGKKVRYGNGQDIGRAQNININWSNKNNQTKEVTNLAPSNIGLYDMSGNVAEWCWDWYDPFYYGQRIEQNPDGSGSGKLRVIRGGNYFQFPKKARTTARSSGRADLTGMGIGFRCVRNK